jgi:hypothetical protein
MRALTIGLLGLFCAIVASPAYADSVVISSHHHHHHNHNQHHYNHNRHMHHD